MLLSSSHHHQAGVYPQCSACSPVSYLSSAFCLSASCSASNAKISSTKGWYSRVILRKPCRKGILQHSALHTSPAGPFHMAEPPAHTQKPAGRPRPGFHGAARSSENKHGFRIVLHLKKHHFPRSQNSRPPFPSPEPRGSAGGTHRAVPEAPVRPSGAKPEGSDTKRRTARTPRPRRRKRKSPAASSGGRGLTTGVV